MLLTGCRLDEWASARTRWIAGAARGSHISQTTSAELVDASSERSHSRFPLPWSHYTRLLAVRNENARCSYESEAHFSDIEQARAWARWFVRWYNHDHPSEAWTAKEFVQQVAAQLFRSHNIHFPDAPNIYTGSCASGPRRHVTACSEEQLGLALV